MIARTYPVSVLGANVGVIVIVTEPPAECTILVADAAPAASSAFACGIEKAALSILSDVSCQFKVSIAAMLANRLHAPLNVFDIRWATFRRSILLSRLNSAVWRVCSTS